MQMVKKRVDPNKIFFKFRCRECNCSIEQPISDCCEVGDPICLIDERHQMEYLYTFMLVKKEEQPLKKKRTKNTPPLSKLEERRLKDLTKKEKMAR